jgi:N-acyl-D-aspartate/D-glutamate deacylase
MKRTTIPRILTTIAAMALLSRTGLPSADGFDYDLLIKNGKVFDGSLKPAFAADVAVKDGIIVKIAKPIAGTAARTIDAKGLIITPGFIDLHTHVEVGMDSLENRPCLNFLTQGVTTVTVGHCGYSPWILYEKPEDQMARLSKEGIGPNMALLVGFGAVRRLAVGEDERKATPAEIEKMKALVREAMDQGAFGMSTSLDYIPGKYADTDEVVEVVKAIAPYGGVYDTHMRKEEGKLIEAVKEVIEIAERGGVAANISHFKVGGKKYWGLSREACALIEKARARGLKITADQYPYRYAGKGADRDLIPEKVWFEKDDPNKLGKNDFLDLYDHLRDAELIELYSKVTPYHPLSDKHKQFLAGLSRPRLVSLVAQTVRFPMYLRMGVVDIFEFGGVDVGNVRQRAAFLKRWNDPATGPKLRQAMKEFIDETGAENIMIEVCEEPAFVGKSLQQVASLTAKPVEETAVELGLMGAKNVSLEMAEDDIEYIMKQDFVGTGSDGDAPFHGLDGVFGPIHLRSYTTFLHKIKKYALERRAVSLEHVIRSQTSLAAGIMNLNDRGWIKEGYKADINVIDLQNIKIRATVANPSRYCEGVKFLVVNGKVVIDGGKWNGILAGRVLNRKG